MKTREIFGIEVSARHLLGIVFGAMLFIANIMYLKGTPFFYPGIVMSFVVASTQFFLDFIIRKQREREMEEKFTEFVRNLVGSVKSGMPFNHAIIHVARIDYGSLTPHVKKLANKVEWTVPMHRALLSFGDEVKNKTIKRAIITVLEAEQAGGNIEDVLDSITTSLINIKNLKEKRRSSIHSQTMQSYIIFFVFLAIMIIVQNVLIPYLASVQSAGTVSFDEEAPTVEGPGFSDIMTPVQIDYSNPVAFIISLIEWFKSFQGIFLMLSLIQGLFAGLVIGKLAEGDVSAGMKHSAILMIIALIVILFAQSL